MSRAFRIPVVCDWLCAASAYARVGEAEVREGPRGGPCFTIAAREARVGTPEFQAIAVWDGAHPVWKMAMPKDRAFPLTITLERQTGVFEVLLEEQAAQARAPSLRAQGSVSTQGRTFKRFLAQGARAGEAIRIDVPTAAGATRVNVLIGVAVVFVLAMLAALARALLRRAPRGVTLPGAGGAPDTSDSLVAAIAALDARHDAGDASLDEAAYASQRAALKSRLAAALAARASAE